MMFHLSQSDWHLIWLMAKLSLPLLVGWGLDRLIRFRNPRLRVVMWRTVSVAVCLELLALNLPRLGHVPVAWDFSAAGTDRTPELVATPSDNEFSPAAPEAIAWSASMNLEPEEPVQPQCPAKAGDLAEARDRRLDEVDTSQSFLEPQQASVGSLVTASGGNTNRIVIGLFMLIYLSVVICLFFREIAAKLRALEIINRSDPVESDVSETFARQLNIANVPIRTSDEIGSPCVVGWRSMLRIDPFPMPRYVSVDVRDFASFGLVQRMLVVATWRGAPGEAEHVSIGAKGFVSSVQEIDTSQAFKLVLARAGMMRGTVVDNVSGDRVEEFSVRLATMERPDQLFPSYAQMTGREGHFELPISFDVEDLMAVIEADGFKAWSRPLDQISLDQLIEVQLERAKELAGSIVSPGGNPVANATVVLTDPSLMFPIPIRGKANFNEPRTFRPQKAQTDIYGKFRFWLDDELPENLVFFVEHEEGFANVKLNELDDDRRVHLEPWTSLEVIAIRDEKPVVGLCVQLRYIDYGPKDGRVSIRPQTYVTDHDGRVRFDKVNPWEAEIITKLAESNVAIGREDIEYPAETTKRITLSPKPNTITLMSDGVRLEAHIDIPPDPLGMRIPKFNESGSISGQSLSGEPQQFQFKANSDGRFVIESIPPGHYQMNFQVGIQVPEGHSGGWMGVGALSDSFEVPVVASRVHSVTFTQSWPKTLAIGDDAVPLVGQLAKGGQVSSRELAGKWLLLDCYSPKSSSYRELLAKIISAYPQWHDAGLEVLSVSLDWQLRDLKSQIELSDGWKQLPWAIISDHQSSSQICEDYQLRSSPMRLLIDPSGKIAYRGDDWDTLERTINTALSGPGRLLDGRSSTQLRESRRHSDKKCAGNQRCSVPHE